MVFSFVIPIYNGEKFIEKCVGSILNQPFKSNDFEIIIVDDGSNDSSVEVCEDLASKYKEIKFFSKANAGPGHTRNFGMDRASGEYIWFIDADDFLIDNVVSDLYPQIQDRLEIYIFGYRAIDLNGNMIREKTYANEVLSPEAALQKDYYVNMVWCKLIRRDILMKTGIRFREDIRGPEDFHFSFRLLLETDKIGFLDTICYNYIENPASLMNTRSEEHMIKLAEDSMTAGNDLSSYLSNYKDPNKIAAFQSWLSNFFYGLYYSFYRFNYSNEYISGAIERLRAVGNYPIELKATGLKRRLFLAVCNNKTLFLLVNRIKG